MKGYRTILLNMAAGLALDGGISWSSIPPQYQPWLHVAVVAWMCLAIVLRLITDTPVGQKLEAKIEQELGITPAQMQDLVARLPQQASVDALMGQIRDLGVAVRALRPAAPPAPAVPAAPKPPAAIAPNPPVPPATAAAPPAA